MKIFIAAFVLLLTCSTAHGATIATTAMDAMLVNEPATDDELIISDTDATTSKRVDLDVILDMDLVSNGTLIVANGGTSATSFTAGAVLLGSGTSTITATTLDDTKIMIGDGSGDPTFAALSGDATMTNAGVVTVVNDLHAHTTTSVSGLLDADIGSDITINSTAQVTSTAGMDIGTSQALTGTTAMTIGNNAQTVNVNSSDWDISATGVATGMGNITSDGTIEGATLTEGGVAVYNDNEMDAFSELDAIVTDKALVNKADGAVWLGTHDFGGAVVEVPNGAAVTDPAAAGQVAIDTTTDQFLYYGGAQRVISYQKEVCLTLEDPVEGDDNIMFFQPRHAITITDVVCRVDGGTSLGLIISDGTNVLETITCATTATEDDGSIANGTFTALERMEFDLGTATGTQTWLNFCVTYTVDAD